ncbi:MAG: polyprenyl synthetase family protein [Bacteroidales bacterium]|jgi:geranylgeranyl diphosphate synthase type II|nr:polyprenyl synthetase family protein [Bacteroidales bacterium]MCK9499902.1 polyprenyl synthetase family protein [Bacteroidales bacterium]MDY0314353.1 polyprenyl synthetase family protein [Bacteroidales bacterium]NLB86344.1 polyprenyl synthetase family protein [Bacteroidales bacterium]
MLNDKELLKIFNEYLLRQDFGNTPSNLYDPIYYTLKAGGKRIRPILCLLSTELFGESYESSLDIACGIEIFHNFTLLHDDMMDKSDIRRGNPTVHKKWTDSIALLSGDAMSVIAYKYISKAKYLSETLDLFSDTALKICEGQQLDMDYENMSDISVEDYLKMINLKTAVFLAASLKIGAISANTNRENKSNIYEFGRNLGMAFQLQDDYLDTYGDSEKFKKNLGGDIASNKKTFLLLKALELAKGNVLNELKYWIALKEFDKNEKINAVKNIYDALNILKYSEGKIDYYMNEASQYFAKINADKNKKDILLNYTNSLGQRKF